MSEPTTLLGDTRRKMMLEDPVMTVIPILAAPMILSMLIDGFYNIADTYFVSQLGTAATAAVGVNDSMLGIMRSISMCFGAGSASYVSRLLGAQREDEANRAGTTSLFTAMSVMALFAVFGYLFSGPIVELLGSTEGSKQFSLDYFRFILISAPFTAGEVVLSQLLRAEGNTARSMLGMVSGCFVNVALDPLFINTFGLAVAGAALATTISKTVSFLVLMIPFLRGHSVVVIHWRYFTPKTAIYLEVARMGIPFSLRSIMMNVSSILINNMAGSYGDSALAAVSVANKCTRLLGAAVMGFGMGFQPLAGYCWGAKRYRRIREAFWACSILGAIAAFCLAATAGITCPTFVRLFTVANDTEVIRISTLMIRTQCVTLVVHVWVIVINGLFQALGKAVPATVLGLSRQVICLIPCVLTLSKLFGVNGLAVAQATADMLSLLIAVPLIIRLWRDLKRMPDGTDAVKPKQKKFYLGECQ